MADNFFPLNTPLRNYLFYAAPLTQNGPNVPLSGGFIFFRSAADHTVLLNTYQDPNGLVLNQNPLPLDAAGSAPPIYMQDILYFIAVTDYHGDFNNPVFTIDNYDPSQNTEPQDIINNNFITNGQFTYPISFYRTDEEVGQITSPVTPVAWGWDFLQDVDTGSENFVTFQDVSNEVIDGSPINQIVLECRIAGSGESTKEFRSIIGNVNFRAGEDITISEYLMSLISATPTVSILIEKNYGSGGSDPEFLSVTSFQINNTRKQYVQQYTLPLNTGKDIGPGNFIAIRFQFAIGQTCQIGFTNALCLPDFISDPTYAEEAIGDTVSQILGNATNIVNAGLPENFSVYTYNDGHILPLPRTGEIDLYTTDENPADTVLCDGSPYLVSSYFPDANVPCQRLYDVIGTTFGSDGDLIVTSSNADVIFTIGEGGVEHSAYTLGNTVGTLSLVQTKAGLALGVNCAITSAAQVTMTWTAHGAISTTPSNSAVPSGVVGDWYYASWGGGFPFNGNQDIQAVTTNPGSSGAAAVVQLNFQVTNPHSYFTFVNPSSVSFEVVNFLEWPTVSSNTHGTFPAFTSLVTFGATPGQFTATNPIVNIQLGGLGSRMALMKAFVKQVANPFIDTFTFLTIPVQSTYVLFSSTGVDYYGWFTVDGVGTDPAVAGRTGVEIPLFSSMDLAQMAAAMASACNDLEFDVPNTTDLPALVMDSKVSWYIHV